MDAHVTKICERLATLEALAKQVPTGRELLDTAASQGKLGAREYMDGLTESFQKDTQRRLETLEQAIGKMKGHMFIVNAVVLILGFVAGQKLPTFLP